MEEREPTYEEAVELLHAVREALVVHVIEGEQAFGLLRTGETVMFPVEEPVKLHAIVRVRPCAAWVAEDGSTRVFARRVSPALVTKLPREVALAMVERARAWRGRAEIWEDLLDQASAWLHEVDPSQPAGDEDEIWARRAIEATVDRHAPIGCGPATFEEAVAGAFAALEAIGFATSPGGYDLPLGIVAFRDPQQHRPWFVSHGTGRMDERDAWRGGLVDKVLRRFGFRTVWFGDPREAIEVQGFRPA
ncbi:MAG: hypothetical protein H6736_13685 [Alphaproteobacteria bacterium]|nr:hypothetical protein [Alphaproteobacteria bacterium]MCB9692857.1 hypothetical protein [Alphaproteobacteria bacterium]